MKRTIITIIVLSLFGVGIAWKLNKNKKENQAKVDFVHQTDVSVSVKVDQVAMKPLSLDMSANGNFAPNQELMFSPEVMGQITSIRVKEGDYVSRGQVLATVDDRYLRLEMETANEQYQKLLVDQKRLESALQSGGVTQAQVDEIALGVKRAENGIEQLRKRLSDVSVKAPISGMINRKLVELGSLASPGVPLFEIVDVSRLKLKLNVDERQVVQLKKGDRVEVRAQVFPDKPLTGHISFIAAKSDFALNFPVEITLDAGVKGEIKPGMYGTAYFNFQESEPALLVPRTAFLGSVKNGEVYIVKNNVAHIRKVTPGNIYGEQVEILQGLEEGETIVIAGQINLEDGAKVKIAN